VIALCRIPEFVQLHANFPCLDLRGQRLLRISATLYLNSSKNCTITILIGYFAENLGERMKQALLLAESGIKLAALLGGSLKFVLICSFVLTNLILAVELAQSL
jgi:hypothetical protein